jgi:tRNA-dihydrouridine synthase 4
MRSTLPCNFEAVKTVKDSLSIPVIGNGNCFKPADVEEWKERTGVNGIMAARGLLQNPAIFAGFDYTPVECISEFVDIAMRTSLNPKLFHQHLLMMLYNTHSKVEKREFNALKSVPAILDFLEKRGFPFTQVDLNDPVPDLVKQRKKLLFDVSSPI